MKTFRNLAFPYAFFMGIFIVLPMVLIVVYALTKPSNQVVIFQFTLENFVRFFDPIFLKIAYKSVEMAFVTTLLCLVIGYPIAYMIAKQKSHLQIFLIILITLPMWINLLIRTYAWIAILSNNGLLNKFLSLLNVEPLELMYTDGAVLIGMVYNYLPFMVISVHTQLTKMDQSFVEASYDLGANWLQTFTKIIFPLSLPGVMSGITLVFLPAVSSFVIPQLLGGGSYMLIGNLIENQFGVVGNWNFGSAVSLIVALVIMLFMALTKKIDKEVNDDSSEKKVAFYGGN